MNTLAYKIAVMKACEEGAAIERQNAWWASEVFEYDPTPSWNWDYFKYRVKPPERKTVKLLAWFDGNCLSWRAEGPNIGATRVPAEDKTIEIE